MTTMGFRIAFYPDRVEVSFAGANIIVASISGNPNNDRRERIARAASELFAAVCDVPVDGYDTIRKQIDEQIKDPEGVSN